MNKQCKNCGEIYSEEIKFCMKCGEPLAAMEEAKANVKPKEKMPRMLIAAICVFVVVAVAVGIKLYLNYSDNTKSVEESEAKAEENKPEEAAEQKVSNDNASENSSQTVNESQSVSPEQDANSADQTEVLETEPEPETDNSDYILQDSGTRLLNEQDLAGLSKAELRKARNEIFARHGRKFKDSELQAYFDSQPWYNGRIAPEDFKEDSVSEIEKRNAEFIQSFE